ncbi:MAG: 1-acyl-sn-glycerol-3-phosphate acyltransferase [Planctomycetes bacterium]|nr:1-acyl-sn-glycerol-3-phosphate acyltransferase [Planctomycetota bacterium]
MTRLSSFLNPALAGFRLPAGVPGPSLWYRFARRVVQVAFTALWQLRCFNRRFEPTEGGALYICNHQSFLDPILMALSLRRPMNFMARDTLFHSRLLKPLMESLDAFPVKRDSADTGAMKEAMRRLRDGKQLVIFAEGTRTADGRIGLLLPGVTLLAQRAAKWTVPVVIEGAFEAWPKSSPLPIPGHIVVQYGRAIPQESARQMPAEEFTSHIRAKLIEIQTDIRRRLGKKQFVYDDR